MCNCPYLLFVVYSRCSRACAPLWSFCPTPISNLFLAVDSRTHSIDVSDDTDVSRRLRECVV